MSPVIAMRGALAAALPLLLAACAGLPSAPANEEAVAPPAQSAERAFHEAVDLGGRLSVRYQTGQKEEALHGGFTWTQTPLRTTVTLLSPLGQTIAVINVTPQGATLLQGGQQPRSAADVDTLTADTLGWPLPVAGLRHWLQGFVLDNAGRHFVATPTAADVITRDGWRIRYANWENDSSPARKHRPKRIDLARFTEQAGDVSIRIVIDTWQAH